jgi:hypothetical protein
MVAIRLKEEMVQAITLLVTPPMTVIRLKEVAQTTTLLVTILIVAIRLKEVTKLLAIKPMKAVRLTISLLNS